MKDETGVTGEASRRLSPFERCVLHLARHLGRVISPAALQDALPRTGPTSRQDEVRAAMRAAEHAGLRAAFGKRGLDQVEPVLLPAILLSADGAFVLHRRAGDKLIGHDPRLGEGLVEIDAAGFGETFTGHVLTLKVEHRHASDERSPAQRRHWFWDAIRANRWSYVQIGLAAALVNTLALATSLFTMVVYDQVLPSAATDSLLALTMGVGLALLFDFIVKSLRAGFIDHAGERVDLEIGQRIFDQLIDTRMAARDGSTGATAATMREFETLRDFFNSATMVALVDLPFVVIFVAAVFFLAGPLGLVPAVAVPLVLAIGVAVQPILGRLSDRILREGQAKQAVLVETLTGLEAIKAAGAGARMRHRWADAIRRQAAHAVRSRTVTQAAINATAFVQQGAQVMIVFFGALMVIENRITSGVLIAAVILTGRALAPLGLIAQALTRLHQARASYRSLDRLMKAEHEHPPGKTWLDRPPLRGEVRFENVSFAYPGQSGHALEGVSFAIQPGERVAVLGGIGSGKTTLMRLLLGLYQPTKAW